MSVLKSDNFIRGLTSERKMRKKGIVGLTRKTFVSSVLRDRIFGSLPKDDVNATIGFRSSTGYADAHYIDR